MARLSSFRRLLALGLLMEAAYVLFLVVPFPLARYFSTPLLDLGKLTGYGPWQAVAAAMALVFALYVLAYRQAGEPRLGRLVIAFAALFALTQAFVYPIGALDVFDYSFFGREMAHYGVNPYLVRPDDFSSDPLLAYVGWKGLPFTYGPAFALVCRAVSMVFNGNLLANVLAFKLIAIAAFLATSVLIYDLLRRESPAHAVSGTLLFAWNPLVVFETASNAHNDMLVMLFAVLGVAAFARRRQARALVALVLSVLTKFVTFPLGPIWLAAGWRAEVGWRNRLAFVARSVALAALVALVLYLPFLGDRADLRTVLLAPLMRQDLFTSSFPALLVLVGEKTRDRDVVEKMVRNGAMALLVAFSLLQAWRVRGDWHSLASASFNTVLFYLLFLCPWFQPWYVLWLVPLAALLGKGWQANTVILFCLSAMAKYLVFDFFWFSSDLLTETLHVEAAAVLFIYALPLGYLAWSFLTSRRRVRRDLRG